MRSSQSATAGFGSVPETSLVRGLVINRFDIDMISIERPAGDAIRIAGNYLGTDITGSDAAGGERRDLYRGREQPRHRRLPSESTGM